MSADVPDTRDDHLRRELSPANLRLGSLLVFVPARVSVAVTTGALGMLFVAGAYHVA